MPIYAPNWVFSRFTTWIFGGVRILLVGQCIIYMDNEFLYVFLTFYAVITMYIKYFGQIWPYFG